MPQLTPQELAPGLAEGEPVRAAAPAGEAGFLRSLARQVTTVLRKDMLLEWRGRSRILSVMLFGVVTLSLFSFAVGPDSVMLRAGASGFLALALLLSSTLALAESFRLEHEQRAIEGLLLLPADPTAIYYGKALGNTIFLCILAPVLMWAALVLYAVEFTFGTVVELMGLWVLSAAGLSAPGTLYAAMTSRLRSQDVLLPLLLFPLVVPVLLGSVKAMDLVISGDPMEQLGSWTLMLLAFDVIYWSLCGILFPQAIEDT